MAMTLTYDDFGLYRKIIADWTSDGSGDASATTRKISGRLVKVTTDPGAGPPTDSYVVTISDSDSVNVCAQCVNVAALSDRSDTDVEETYLNLVSNTTPVASTPVVNDVLTIAISAAGDTTSGQIILVWTPL